MLTVTAPVIMRNVWSMSVQMTAEKPPKMVKRPHMHKRMMMETYIVDRLCESDCDLTLFVNLHGSRDEQPVSEKVSLKGIDLILMSGKL